MSYYLRIYIRHRFITQNNNKELDEISYIIIPVCQGQFFLPSSKNKLIGRIDITSSCGRPVSNFLCIILYLLHYCMICLVPPKLYLATNTMYLVTLWPFFLNITLNILDNVLDLVRNLIQVSLFALVLITYLFSSKDNYQIMHLTKKIYIII